MFTTIAGVAVAVVICWIFLVFLVKIVVVAVFHRVLCVQMGRLLDYNIATRFVTIFLFHSLSICSPHINCAPEIAESLIGLLWFVFHSKKYNFLCFSCLAVVCSCCCYCCCRSLFIQWNEYVQNKQHVQRNIKIRRKEIEFFFTPSLSLSMYLSVI